MTKSRYKVRKIVVRYLTDSPYDKIIQYLDTLEASQKNSRIQESLFLNLLPETSVYLNEINQVEIIKESIRFAELRISYWKQYLNLNDRGYDTDNDNTLTHSVSSRQTTNNNSFDSTEKEKKESNEEYEKAMKVMDMFGEE